jgi:hypothetical protein
MGLIDGILGNAAGSVLNSVKGIIGSFVTDPTQKMEAEKQIQEAIQKTIDDQIQDAKDSITTEETGNWLQKSWRPIVMLSFTFILIYQYFLSKVLQLPTVDLPPDFFTLLKIGIGGYMGLRSAEKIIPNLTNKN